MVASAAILGAATIPVQQATPDADALACSLENPESCEACQ